MQPEETIINLATSTKSISDNDCHFYLGTTHDFSHRYDELYKTLDAVEKQKANSFKFEKDKKLYVIAHGILRELIGSYFNCNPSSINFINNDSGKPHIANSLKVSDLQFSLSHSVDCFVIAFNLDEPIGADVERIVPGTDHSVIIENYFSVSEKEQLGKTTNKDKFFYQLWTEKEAIGKVSGTGVTNIPNLQLQEGYKLYNGSLNNYQYAICYPGNKEVKILPLS